MLILRIRQAEVAARAGRLEEALDLVQRDGRFAQHRRGQDAITRIIAGFVRRAREHLAAGRLAQAGTDIERAGRLGGAGLPEVAQLASELRDVHEARQREQRDAALAVAAAKRYVEDGALSIGRRMLATIDDSRAKRLMTDIDDHRARLDAALAAIKLAADRADWHEAAEAVARARGVAPADARLADLSVPIVEALSRARKTSFTPAVSDRAAETAEALQLADPDSPAARDIARALEHCRSATTCLDLAKPHDAAERLRRVSVLFPKASWINEALKQVDAVADAMDQLRAGPLSLVHEIPLSTISAKAKPLPASLARTAHLPQPAAKASPAAAFPMPALGPGAAGPARPAGSLPDRFILQVDGAGAFLVVRGAVVKVGPISSSALPDVALVADATAPSVTIERVEDDYFLRGSSVVALNDKPATEALLNTNDRLGLSPRCRFTFAIPHPASTTAVLDLVGARYPRGDVRRVILMDRDLILGPGSAAHVRVNGLASPVVLHLRNGVLRPSVEAAVAGQPLPREAGLPLDVPITAGGASFVLSRA